MNNNLHAKLNHLKLQLEVLREVFHQQLQIESWYCKLFHNKVNDIIFGHSLKAFVIVDFQLKHVLLLMQVRSKILSLLLIMIYSK